MTNKVIEYIKEHPYGTAAVVFIVGVIIIYSNSGSGGSASASSGSGSASDAYAAEVNAATQLQGEQLAAQSQAQQVQAQANVAAQQTAAQVTVAQLGAQTQQNYDSLSAQTAQLGDTLSAQTTQVVATLQAQVANNQTQAAVTEQSIAANEYTQINAQNVQAETQIAEAPYMSADYIAQLNSQDYLASLPANAQITNLQNEIAALAGNVSEAENADTGGLYQLSNTSQAAALNSMNFQQLRTGGSLNAASLNIQPAS